MANSAFTPAVLTVSGSSSTSSGEKNYVTATDGNASGLWVASGVTVATSTSTIPDNITKASSLAITWTSGTTGYARYRFTLDQADYGKKFKIQWDQVYGTAGHWTLQVWSNTASDYTGTSTQLTVQTSAVPGITGTFTTSVDMPGSTAPYIEIRIVASSTSATTIYLNSILMGPGTIVQGAAISEWQNFATNPTLEATTTNPTLGSTGSTSAKYRRVGSVIEVDVSFVFGGTGINFGNGSYRIALPTGFTIDYNALSTIGGGEYSFGKMVGYVATTSGATRYTITGEFLSAAGSKIYLLKGNGGSLSQTDFSTTGIISVQFSAPLSEWSGSGTVSLGAGAQIEYASVGGTWDADSSTTVYGPNGSTMGGALTLTRDKTITWQYPPQSDDILTLEFKFASTDGGWVPLADVWPNDNNNVGAYILQTDSTGKTVVRFRRYRTGTSDWLNTYQWRVRKAKASSPVGFGKADSTSFGLVGPRKGQYSVTVSASPAFSSSGTAYRFIAIYYQDQDGNHRLKFNFKGNTVSGATSIILTLTGVVFKNVSGFNQTFACLAAGSAPYTASGEVGPNGSTMSIYATTSSTDWRASGDVELESKPTWA